MAVEVETPEDYAGSVMGDLSSRRGMVQGMDDMPGGGKVIKAEVPLSEMFGYSPRCARCRRAVPPSRWNSTTTRCPTTRRCDHHLARQVAATRWSTAWSAPAASGSDFGAACRP